VTGRPGPSPSSQRPPFIGLTGGIAAGKSEALAALARLGAATLSTDAVVRELLATAEIRSEVVRRLGEGVAPGGRLDRDAVAAAVFERPDDRAWLEGLLWPRVGERVAVWRDRQAACRPPPKAIVVEVPLLFESGMDAVFDATIAVVADEATRERRAAARGHLALESRTSRQLEQKEKAQRADFVVHNDGGIADLERELATVLSKAAA
jgi:dephospho-CoA kinase